jgi:predicted ATPase
MRSCTCGPHPSLRRIVVTGGPGAGKTAVLELMRHAFCRHVRILEEAAGIVFGGGFPREVSPASRRAAQRAIFHVQRELEAVADADGAATVICDRGTLDGLAYWPGPGDLCAEVGTTAEQELARYAAVIHLRTPSETNGYDHTNPLRVETAAEALAIDQRIEQVWAAHPKRFVVPATSDFLEKAERAIEILRGEVSECCAAKAHPRDPAAPSASRESAPSWT